MILGSCGDGTIEDEPGRNRTFDLRLKRPLLYRLSYGPIFKAENRRKYRKIRKQCQLKKRSGASHP